MSNTGTTYENTWSAIQPILITGKITSLTYCKSNTPYPQLQRAISQWIHCKKKIAILLTCSMGIQRTSVNFISKPLLYVIYKNHNGQNRC